MSKVDLNLLKIFFIIGFQLIDFGNINLLGCYGDNYCPQHVKEYGLNIRKTLDITNQLLPFEAFLICTQNRF